MKAATNLGYRNYVAPQCTILQHTVIECYCIADYAYMTGRIHLPGWKVTALMLAWAGAVLGGLVALARYDNTTSAQEPSAARAWPRAAIMQFDRERPTLLMCLHPQCPCSRASLDELEVLIARSSVPLAATVIFVRPQGAPADWTSGDLWRHANAIPGVRVAIDEGGHDAQLFGAQDSGQTYLYNTSGELLFSGGITESRGHDGDSDGLMAILTLLHGQTPRKSITPVYGCSLETGCSAGMAPAVFKVGKLEK